MHHHRGEADKLPKLNKKDETHPMHRLQVDNEDLPKQEDNDLKAQGDDLAGHLKSNLNLKVLKEEMTNFRHLGHQK